MSLVTLTLAGCQCAPPPASVSGTAATHHGSPLLHQGTTTTIFVATTMKAIVKAAQAAQNPVWSSAQKGRGYPWPTVIPWALWVVETVTETWEIITETFWTARWLRHPTTLLAALVSVDANWMRRQEKVRKHLRSYRLPEQEGITRPRPASHCPAVRFTCDSLATERSACNYHFTEKSIKTLLSKACKHHIGKPLKAVKMSEMKAFSCIKLNLLDSNQYL